MKQNKKRGVYFCLPGVHPNLELRYENLFSSYTLSNTNTHIRFAHYPHILGYYQDTLLYYTHILRRLHQLLRFQTQQRQIYLMEIQT